MGNEFLKAMNLQTKKYFVLALNLIEYIHQNPEKFALKDDELTSANEFAYGFFIAGIIYNSEIREIFYRYNSSLKDVFSSLSNNFSIEFNDKDLEDTVVYKNYNLNEIKADFVKRLKERLNLQNEKLYISDIDWYQIFYYICEVGRYNVENLIKSFNVEACDEILDDINNFVLENDLSFLNKIGYKKISFDNISLYFYNNGKIILKSNNPKDVFYLWHGCNNFSVKIEQDCEVVSINDETCIDYNKFINDILNKDSVSLKLKTVNTNEEYLLSANVSSIFCDSKKDKTILSETKDNNTAQANKFNDTPTPFLNKYGTELTNSSYIKDPSVGRENEIKQIEQVLLYPEKDKSIIIVGDAGVGKTALVRGLSYRIQNGDVPNALKNIRIFSLNVSSLIEGTKYVGTLEEKMKNILNEASKNKNIILFIDEIHQAMGAGNTESSKNSISEILKPYIDYGDVRIIGATTHDEYNEYIQTDTAFKSRLKKVTISEPNNDVLYEIIDDLINKYNQISYSKLDISDVEKTFIINWLIESTQKRFRTYNDSVNNPRLVLDIIKEAYAIAAYYNREHIEHVDLCEALMNENRLYESSRLNQIRKLNNFVPKKEKSNIIKFVPKKREN